MNTISQERAKELGIPEEVVPYIQTLIERPKLLKLLIMDEIAALEDYAAHPANKEKLSNQQDKYSNYLTMQQDCLGRAAFYKNVVKALDLYK